MRERLVDTREWVHTIQELIEEGKEVPMVITGYSMTPFLVHKRDSVLLAKVDQELRRGDMVFYCRPGGQYVLHRIVKFDSAGGVYFAGDAQDFIEGPLPRECIFALVKAVKRKENWIRPGDFWWDFFAGFWLKVLPFRRLIIKMYGISVGRIRRWKE